MTIRDDAPASVFKQIAELHEAQLEAGLLSELGVQFLAKFYRVAAVHGLLFVEMEGTRVSGFLLGAISTSDFYRSVLPKVFLAIVAAILRKPKVLHRAISVSGNVRSSNTKHGAELLSVAISPHKTRTGLGKRLLGQFKQELSARGIREFQVSASDTQKSALQFYAKNGGKIISECDLGGLRTSTFVLPV